MQKARQLWLLGRVSFDPNYQTHFVQGATKRYSVTYGDRCFCPCQGFQSTGKKCSHIIAVAHFLHDGEPPHFPVDPQDELIHDEDDMLGEDESDNEDFGVVEMMLFRQPTFDIGHVSFSSSSDTVVGRDPGSGYPTLSDSGSRHVPNENSEQAETNDCVYATHTEAPELTNGREDDFDDDGNVFNPNPALGGRPAQTQPLQPYRRLQLLRNTMPTEAQLQSKRKKTPAINTSQSQDLPKRKNRGRKQQRR
jgi:hypothetical protein